MNRHTRVSDEFEVASYTRLDRAFGWLFARYRRNYIYLLLAGTAVSVVFTTLFLGALLGLVLVDPHRWVSVMAVVVVSGAFGIPTLIFLVIVHHGPAARYLRGTGTQPSAETVWRTSVTELPRSVGTIAIGYAIPMCIGAGVYAWKTSSPAVLLAIEFGIVVGTALVGALFFLFWEAALRPLVRELAPVLPDDLILRTKGASLSSKLFVLLLCISLFNGFMVGALALFPPSHDERLTVTVVATLVLAAVLAISVVWLLRHSFVSRVDELRRALIRVEGGARDGVHLPPLAGDDFDEVTAAFNRMVRELAQGEADMRASRARIVAVADDERRRMERDLHDGAQQYLSLMKLQLNALKRTVGLDSKAITQVDELEVTVAQGLEELRNLAHGIYPGSLESGGLPAALADAAHRATVPTAVDCDGVGRFSREVEAAVYFCCLEALQNAGKYAGEGAQATIALGMSGGQLTFSVADDGVGFDVESVGHGFTNMRDRIGALGGDVSVSSSMGAGTVVAGWVPVGASDD